MGQGDDQEQANVLAAGQDEHLLDGWEPDLVGFDTIGRALVDNTIAELAHPAEAMGGRVQITDDVAMADLASPCAFLNGAVLRRPLTYDGPDPVLDQIDAFFAASPGPVVIYSASPTPDLRDRGWQPVGHPPLMVRAPGGAPPAPPDRFRFARVEDDAALQHFGRILVEGYPIPELQPWRHDTPYDARVLGDDQFHLYLGYEDDQPVSCAAAVVDDHITGVHMVANDPEVRGQGYGEATVWAATLADPTKPAVLIASDLGRPTYQRMGYLTVTRWTIWLRPPG